MSPKHEFLRQSVFFTGQVQGVGFRYRACQTARGFDVTGFVRNLGDGRVEMVVEGERSTVHDFVNAVRTDMQEYIRGIQTHDSPGTGEFDGFEIRS